MLKLIQYYLYSIRYPHLREFIDSGLGIAARHERCAAAWEPHLKNTKTFQEKSFSQNAEGGELVICGAGRGFDIEIAGGLKYFSKILLLDADPLSKKPCLEKFGHSSKVKYDFVELSGALIDWREKLLRVTKSRSRGSLENEICDLLRGLSSTGFTLPKPDSLRVTVSLNILSQIPIHWRQTVQKILKDNLNIDTDDQDNLPSPYEDALRASCRELQRSHMNSLKNLGSREILCIYDTAFVYSRNGEDVLKESAIYIEPKDELPGYRVADTATWRWNIAPQAKEFKDYGVGHEVRAERFISAESSNS